MKKNIKCLIAVLMCMIMCFTAAACGGNSEKQTDKSAATETTAAIDPNGTSLTIKGAGFEKSYTADELAALGTDTITYSGRNKNVENTRVFQEKTGVDLKKLLLDAGASEKDLDEAIIKVTASDEYVNEYELAELYTEKYAFKDNESNACEAVGAMIAINTEKGDYPSPFQLVFGQAKYDSFDNSAQDYNMQNWGSYIQLIEVSLAK